MVECYIISNHIPQNQNCQMASNKQNFHFLQQERKTLKRLQFDNFYFTSRFSFNFSMLQVNTIVAWIDFDHSRKFSNFSIRLSFYTEYAILITSISKLEKFNNHFRGIPFTQIYCFINKRNFEQRMKLNIDCIKFLSCKILNFSRKLTWKWVEYRECKFSLFMKKLVIILFKKQFKLEQRDN